MSAVLAPSVLIGGWTLAASRQPGSYDPVSDTISALAARGANDRWLMTSALAALGGCHLVTATGLRTARLRARLVLSLGGLATIAVAALPEPAHGSSAAHGAAAALSFAALTLWPALAGQRRAAAVLAALLAWFVVSLADGHLIGLSERAVAAAQAVWILIAVITARRGRTGHAKGPRGE